MGILVQIAIAIIAAAAIFGVIWSVYGTMLTPVRHGKNTELLTVISVRDDAPELEQTLEGLMWLEKNGVLDARIVIADRGMDEETGQVAELCAKKHDKIDVVRAEDVEKWIETGVPCPATDSTSK